MDLSIIIPAYNEEAKIAGDIEAASKFLQDHNLKGEIIIVDDGSEDRTAKVAEQAAEKVSAAVHVIRFSRHRGKGSAVREGILSSKGKWVMFADSGLCTPYENALRGLELLQKNECDLAHGSRKLPQSRIKRPQPLLRRLIGRFMRRILILWMGVPSRFTDTQCGFKIYKGDVARELYRQSRKHGFLFDVEIIMLALRAGYRIKEFPIEWAADLDSRLSPFKNFLGIVKELITLKLILGKIKK